MKVSGREDKLFIFGIIKRKRVKRYMGKDNIPLSFMSVFARTEKRIWCYA